MNKFKNEVEAINEKSMMHLIPMNSCGHGLLLMNSHLFYEQMELKKMKTITVT